MKTDEWYRRAEAFVRSYTRGVDGGGLRRLFDEDAARAYSVITREHEREKEPEHGFWRFLYRARIFLLGVSYKLSPPRRVLFAICLALAMIGTFAIDFDTWPTLKVSFFLLLSVAGLVLLLVLELADRIIVRDELEIARDLQRELLPREQPPIADTSMAFSYRTANTIGGDYYDFFALDDGRFALIVGDASGHGIAAGLLMATASSALKLALDHGSDPVEITRTANRALCRVGNRRSFMTLFCGIYDPRTGRLDHVCAGHPFPLLRRTDGAVVELGRGSLPLGMRTDLELEAEQVDINPGDILVMYTDGIVETLNPAGESFGFERLRRALTRAATARDIHDRIIAELERFRGQAPVHDDYSLVVITRAAP